MYDMQKPTLKKRRLFQGFITHSSHNEIQNEVKASEISVAAHLITTTKDSNSGSKHMCHFIIYFLFFYCLIFNVIGFIICALF